jgi:hypothetical protein
MAAVIVMVDDAVGRAIVRDNEYQVSDDTG